MRFGNCNRTLSCLLLALTVGCKSPAMVSTKLVGGQASLGWNGWSLYLVEVHQRTLAPIPGLDRLWRRERVDTIPHIRSTGTVAVVGDTMIIGVGGSSATAWQYDVRTKELFRRPQPQWLNASWPTPPPSFSTDGRFLAYLSQDHDTTRLTVRSWPDGRIVAQSAPVQPRQLNPPRGGSFFWGNPTLLNAIVPVSDSGPSFAALRGEVHGDRLEIVDWRIYPDYEDPQVRQLMEERAARVNAARSPQVLPVADTSMRARFDSAAKEIRRLPPSAFPELPKAFAAQLERLGCTIPQSAYAGRLGNVIHGSFGARGQDDWAVLCSRNGTSVVLVYWSGPVRCPNEFGVSEDKYFLQGLGEGQIGFSRGISPARSYHVYPDDSDTASVDRDVALEHDGIEDAFQGKASSIFFCQNGKWVRFGGAD